MFVIVDSGDVYLLQKEKKKRNGDPSSRSSNTNAVSHSHRQFISARLLGRLFFSVLSSSSVALINLRDSGLYADVGCRVATGTKDTLKSDISDQSYRNEIHLQKSESKRFRPPKIVVLNQLAKITFHDFCFLFFVICLLSPRPNTLYQSGYAKKQIVASSLNKALYTLGILLN